MTNKDKRLLLIKELTDLTKQGTLQWEKAVQPGSYIATFPNSAVRVSWQAPLGTASFSLQLIDGRGDVTETITATPQLEAQRIVPRVAPGAMDPAEFHEPLAELYQEVLRAVDAVSDKTLDDLFSELRRLRGETARAS